MVDSDDPEYVPFVKSMSRADRLTALANPAHVQYLRDMREICDAMGESEHWLGLPIFDASSPVAPPAAPD